MRKIYMPPEVRKIIDTLYESGYEAYIVGGCVRDELLGRAPGDYDITTSAPPSEIKRLFDKTVDTGIQHGTVTVIENGKPYEVTTFRIDGEYKDNRHPVSISYTNNVRDDLSRRDFTVNALAYNDREGIVDAFFGIQDLECGIIRCVRDPDERFSEDALRVLRGIRFSSVLGFEIETNTALAIKRYAANLADISSERIYSEWKKLLGGKNAHNVISCFKEVIDVFIPELVNKKMPTRESFSALEWDERQISLFVPCENSNSFSSFAKRIKMDSATRDTGVSVLNSINELTSGEKNDIRAFLIGRADKVSLKCAKIATALGMCGKEKYEQIKALIERDSVRRISQLDVNGNDILELGIEGKALGKLLEELLYLVATEKLQNKKDILAEYIAKQKI